MARRKLKHEGQWKKGQSGNPSGRPKEYKEVVALARAATPEAMQTLVDIMLNGTKDSARIKAAEVLLDRAWGRAPQFMQLTGKDGGPLEFKDAKKELAQVIDALVARQLPANTGDVG